MTLSNNISAVCKDWLDHDHKLKEETYLHCVGFSTGCLSVSKYGAIISIEDIYEEKNERHLYFHSYNVYESELFQHLL